MSHHNERYVYVPFPVLFMKVFGNVVEARELLEIVTSFLLSKKKLDILTAEVVRSETGWNRLGFSLRVAWKGSTFGVHQMMHSGFQFTDHWDPYASVAPDKEPKGGAIAGMFFKPEWRVRVPLRFVPIEIEEATAADEQEVA